MAATADKYSRDTWNDKDTVSGQTTTKNIYAYLPLALTEYKQNPSDTSEAVATSDASFCNKFFCHSVWKLKDSEGKDCVVGLLNPLETSTGASGLDYNQLHRLTTGDVTNHVGYRKGKMQVVKNGVTYNVLNDGGLNTKPMVNVQDIDHCYQNLLVFHVQYQNAYYSNTENVILHINYYHDSGSGFPSTPSNDITIPLSTFMNKVRKASGTDVYFSVNLASTSLGGSISVGDKIEIFVKSYNDETGPAGSNSSDPYVSNKVVAYAGPEVQFIDAYKITSLSDDPLTQGTRYNVVLPSGAYALKDSGAYKVLLESGDTGHPNLMNVFFVQYDWNPNSPYSSTSPKNPNYDNRAQGDSGTSEVYLTGSTGASINENTIVNYNVMGPALPQGYYWNFPMDLISRYPDEPRPPYFDHEYVLTIGNSDGRVVGWHSITDPTPVVPDASWASSNPISIVIGSSGLHTSYAVMDGASSVAYVYPEVTVAASQAGKAIVNISCSVVDHYDHTQVYFTATKALKVVFTAASMTQTIHIVEAGEEETETTLPVFELPFIYDSLSQNRYDVVLKVVSTSPALASYSGLDSDGEIDTSTGAIAVNV